LTLELGNVDDKARVVEKRFQLGDRMCANLEEFLLVGSAPPSLNTVLQGIATH